MKYIAHARVGSKRRVSIPGEIRTLLSNVQPGDYIIFFKDGEGVYLQKGEIQPLHPSVLQEVGCLGFSKLTINLRIRILENVAELLGGAEPDDFLLFARKDDRVYITKGGLTGAGRTTDRDEG